MENSIDIKKLIEKEMSPENFKEIILTFQTYLISKDYKKIIKYIDDIKLLIENIIEYLITNKDEYFKVYEENNCQNLFCLLIDKKNKILNLFLIQKVSFYLANLKNKEQLLKLFSSEFIKKIISEQSDNRWDSDFLYYYINLLKSLVMKIDESTIEFFYHKELNTFPLLTNTLGFYNHTDEMNTNVVRNIFLSILKINNELVREFICSLPTLSYFNFLACRMRDMIKTFNKKIKNEKLEEINILHDNIIDSILFFQDIFSVGIEKINYILTNTLFYYVILSQLCASLVLNEDPPINILVAFYIFILFLKYIKNEGFINSLVAVLLCDKLHYGILQIVKTKPLKLVNYEGDWDENRKKKKINFEEYIMMNFNEKFIKGLIHNNNSKYSEMKKLNKKFEEKYKNNEFSSNEDELYKNILDILNTFFNKKELQNCKNYHSIIAISTGIQCGLTYKDDRKCFTHLLKKSMDLTKRSVSQEVNENKFIKNEIRENLLSMIKSKDDNLFLLFSVLIYLITNNKYISHELLSHIKFLNPEIIKSLQKNDNDDDDEDIDDIKVLNINQIANNTKEKETMEPITFTNLTKYKNKKDFNLETFTNFNNERIKQYLSINQNKYNYDMFGKYLNNINVIYRPITINAAIINLKNLLIYYENGIEKTINIDYKIHGNLLRRIFIYNVNTMNKMIEFNSIIKSQIRKIYFEDLELKEKFKDINLTIDNVIKDSYVLLSPDIRNKIINYPNYYYINNDNNDTIEFKNRFFCFLCLYDFYLLILENKKINIEFENVEVENYEEFKIKIKNNEEFFESKIEVNNIEIKINDKNYNLCDLIEINIDENNKNLLNIKILNVENDIIINIDDNEEKIKELKELIENKRNKYVENDYLKLKKYFDDIILENENKIK